MAESPPTRRPDRRAFALLAALAFAAYLPSLWGGFVYDDERFVVKNDAVHELSLTNVVRYFTDPTTVASQGTEGIYRPLRTLDFAVDWALSGGAPVFFHLRNILYHVLACLLVLAILGSLLTDVRAALAGAAVFALHPVHSKSVAWISSRGDLLLLFWFLLALHLYLRKRPWAALAAFVVALFSKESAVVFPAIVLLVDLFRRRRPGWVPIAIYGIVAVAYIKLWQGVLAVGSLGEVGHLAQFWGGSWGANLLVMAKGFAYYAKLLLFPVELVIDYHIPSGGGLDTGSATGILVIAGILAAAIAGGARSRFALAWFGIAILPASNLIAPIGIPTAERFLYLPAVGLAIWAGPLLARHGKAAGVLLGCFFLLTFARTLDWRSNEALWSATEKVAVTPRGLAHRVNQETELAIAVRDRLASVRPASRRAEVAALEAHAGAAILKAEELIALYRDEIGLPAGMLGSSVLTNQAKALLLLGRQRAALKSIDRAIRVYDWGGPYYQAGVALFQLERYQEAALNMEAAVEKGYEDVVPIDPQIAHLWNLSAAAQEALGHREEALAHFRRSFERFPDPVLNSEAAEGVRRLE